jgi:uncharacterized membrane protein
VSIAADSRSVTEPKEWQMNLPHHQQGLGFAGWMLLILVFGFALSVAMKLVPLYMDNSTIVGVLEGVGEEEGMAAKRAQDIEKIVQARFHVNNIRDFDYAKNINVVRDNRGAKIVLDYEVRMPMVANLDLVASFNKTVDLRD